MKRLISFALTLTLVVTMCFGGFGAADVHAAGIEGTALTVYDGDKLVKEYTLDDLKAIAKAEGDIKYKFSGYNRNPSFYTFGDENAYPDVKEVVGPTVAGILADAGVTYNSDQLISFTAADGLTESFVAGDFFRERYYFPNGKIAVPYKGTLPAAANYEGAEPVVPMIDLHRSHEWESVLRFGQVAPNEQNNSAFVKYVADGGSIRVGDVQTVSWEPVVTANYNSGDILPETEIQFDLPVSIIGKKVQAYFTTDGSEPGYGSAIYNYDKYGEVQQIVLPQREGPVTYKFKVVGYGKLDSEVTTFTYNVVNVELARPEIFTVTAENGQAILTWSAVTGADGYQILRYSPETDKYEVYSQVEGADTLTFVDTAVTTGQEFSYQVRAFRTLSSGQTAIGSAALKQTVVIPEPPAEEPSEPSEPAEPEPPTVAKPALTSAVKTGYGGIQIKWTKVADADGYEVWRYDAVSKKWARVKTFANGSTVSWKNTGLKTGRKYTYKVRAYVNFNDGKVFSAYSGTRAATPALNKPVISKLTAGPKFVTVKWNKVPGANGYKIYRSATGKAGSFKVVKTINKGGTVSWKNTQLKKGKRYYYKVKAYRIVDKKYVYSSISSAKYIKAK